MFRNIKQTTLIAALTYGLLYLFVSVQIANFALVLFILSFIALYILKTILAPYLYKYSYRIVPKELVKDRYTLINEHCIVKYSPNEKLSVQDNLTREQRREKRIFTVYKYKKAPVDKCWDEICNIFNNYTYFDSLAALVSKLTSIKIKLIPTTFDVTEDEVKLHENNENKDTNFDDKEKSFVKAEQNIKIKNNPQNTEFISMDEISPDKYGVDISETSPNDEYFVNFDSIKKVNPSE